jgi:exosortase
MNDTPTTTETSVQPSLRAVLPYLAAAGVLLVVCYLPAIRALVRDWMIDENVSHGFFVPLVAIWVAWQSQDALKATPLSPHWFGLVIVAGAGLQFYVAVLGAEDFLARTALVFAIIGSIIWIGGWKIAKILAFPLFLLFFMIPIPSVIYYQLTMPMQFLASDVAERTLSIVGIPVLREGNILELPSQRLSVVEACSGIRSLLSLSFLSLVYGYFFENRTWVRVALFVSTVPIAIIANSARVSITGVVSEIDPELAQGIFHFAEGWVVFVAALGMLVLFHRIVVYAIHRSTSEASPEASQS